MAAIAEIGSAFLTIAPSLRGFGGALNAQAGGTIRSSGKSLGATFGKAFLLGGSVLAAAGIGSFLKDSIAEAREAQKVGALTTNVIKQTGGAANISAKQVGDLSTAISLKTGIDDEAIQSGANLLLTFKNVRNEAGKGSDVFDRATQAATDLSAAGFGDLNGASKQLGKALNDPVKGITALSRSGVTFTDQQKAQIKTLTESGHTLDAQKIILGEVESQVGGAAAASSTFGEKASVAFGNIKEQVGTALLPVVDSLFRLFLKSVPTITKIIGGIGPAFGRISTFLSPFIKQIQGAFSGGGGGGFLSSVRSAAGSLASTLGPALASLLPVARTVFGFLVAQVPRVGSFIQSLGPIFSQVLGLLPTVFGVIKGAIAAALPIFQTLADTVFNVILPAVRSFASYIITALVPVFQQVAGIITGKVLPIFSSLAVFFYGTLYPAFFKIITAVAQNLRPVFDQLVATFQSQVLPAANKLLAAFQRAQPTLQKVALFVLKVVGAVLKFAASVIGKVLPVVIRLVGFLIGKMVPVLISVVGGIAKAIGAVINFGKAVVDGVKSFVQFANGVRDKISVVIGIVQKLPAKIKAFFTKLPGELKTLGGNIIDGLKNGIKAAGQRVLDAVQGIVDKIPKFIRKKLGIASPSKVTTKLGAFVGDGLAVGMASRTTAVGDAARKMTEAAGKGVETAAQKAAKKAKDAAKKLVDGVRDGLRDKVSGLRDDFASLSQSVSGAFTGNLFEATNSGDFIKNLLGTQGQLQALKAAFNKLLGYGLKPAFLSQLFASGNGGLILDLAAQDQATATQAGSLFGSVTDLSTQLGDKVAQADVGPKIDATNALLTKLVSLQGGAAVAFAKELNGTATKGKKNGKKTVVKK